jgi:hypothetical protein
MKHYLILHCVTLLGSLTALGQGTFVYDQQAYDNEFPPPFGSGSAIQLIPTPFGQSFTPTLSSVGFIRLIFADHSPSNGLGATLFVNLRADSLSGAILSTTPAVTLPDSFRGTADFFFPAPVAVTPGVKYYFEPLVQSGDLWNTSIVVDSIIYLRGECIVGGQPQFYDLWFREGIIVPEPCSASLLVLGGGVLAWARRRG